jgi:arsenate reductase-like glutaredoxin family protein
VIGFVSDAGFGSDERRRTLKNIAAFSEERAKRSTFERIRKKQSDADEIKKWEKELKMSYERFIVTTTLFMSCV